MKTYYNEQINLLYNRINKTPDEQRLLFALENIKYKLNFYNLSSELQNKIKHYNDKLKIMTFNMYYGRLINISKNSNTKSNIDLDKINIGIQIDKYECIFKNKIDIICLQEVVFSKLPKYRLHEGNNTKQYINRAIKMSNKQSKMTDTNIIYWKNWTTIFKEIDFEESWTKLVNIASKYGYTPFPKNGGDATPCSMYQQKFGNVIFYNLELLQNKGYSVNINNSFHIDKTILSIDKFNESEERSCVILCLEKKYHNSYFNKSKQNIFKNKKTKKKGTNYIKN